MIDDQQLQKLLQQFNDSYREITSLNEEFFKLSEESKATDRINRQARYLSIAAIVISVIGFVIRILAVI